MERRGGERTAGQEVRGSGVELCAVHQQLRGEERPGGEE